MAKLRMRAVLSAIAAGILITIGGCTEQAPTSNAAPEVGAQYQRLEVQGSAIGSAFDQSAARVEKVIGAEGGTLEIPGGHRLTFPAGAVSAPTRIRAKVDARYAGVELDPHGIRFPAGAEPTLTLSYAAAGPISYVNFAILYTDVSGRFLENMGGSVNTANKSVSARLPHFSGYVIGAY